MTTLLITHDQSGLNHLTPLGHPERPDRLRALAQVFEEERFQPLKRVEAQPAPLEIVALCHPMDYVQALREATPKQGIVAIDADTSMSPGSFEAAVRAVGGATHAVDEVVGKRADNAFVCMRPPGHHTETARAMGFCLFNSAAIAARYAQDHHGLGRVAVIDFDVHHGNGTQDIFWDDKTAMYCSTHQMPLYPGTGAKSETGSAEHHRQCAALRRRRRRQVSRGVQQPHPAAAARLRSRAGGDLGGLRRPQARSARQPPACGRRLRLGDPAIDGDC